MKRRRSPLANGTPLQRAAIPRGGITVARKQPRSIGVSRPSRFQTKRDKSHTTHPQRPGGPNAEASIGLIWSPGERPLRVREAMDASLRLIPARTPGQTVKRQRRGLIRTTTVCNTAPPKPNQSPNIRRLDHETVPPPHPGLTEVLREKARVHHYRVPGTMLRRS